MPPSLPAPRLPARPGTRVAKLDVEAASAAPSFAFGPHAAIVVIDQVAHDGQSQAKPFRVRAGAPTLLEHVEHLLELCGRQSDAFVPDGDQDLAIRHASGVHPDHAARVAVLRRIVQQVGKHLDQPRLVAGDPQSALGHVPLQWLSPAGPLGGRLACQAQDLGQVHRAHREGQLATRNARDIQQIVHQALHVVHLPLHHVQLGPPGIAHAQHLQRHDDRRQRVAQLVPQHRQEFILRTCRLGGTTGFFAKLAHGLVQLQPGFVQNPGLGCELAHLAARRTQLPRGRPHTLLAGKHLAQQLPRWLQPLERQRLRVPAHQHHRHGPVGMRHHQLRAVAIQGLDLGADRPGLGQGPQQRAPQRPPRQRLADAGRRQHDATLFIADQQQPILRTSLPREARQRVRAFVQDGQAGGPRNRAPVVHGQSAMTRTTAVQLWNPLN